MIEEVLFVAGVFKLKSGNCCSVPFVKKDDAHALSVSRRFGLEFVGWE